MKAEKTKLLEFVEQIARQATCEEEPGWKSGDTPLSDDNQEITLNQSYWADELIEEARALTGVTPKKTAKLRVFTIYYKPPPELVYTVSARSEEEAKAKFFEQFDNSEEIIRIE